MIKHILAASVAALLATAAAAQGVEADIKKKVEAALGESAKVDSVRKAGALNLYEVTVGSNILYTDEKVSHVVFGQIIEAKSGRNLTRERIAKLSAIKFSDLPLDLAIKQVKGNGGNGKRVIATFEDPNCGFCKKLAKELQTMTDITIYTFLVPVYSGGAANEKNRAIWCAPDRVKAWNDYMIKGTVPASAKCDTTALDKVADLAVRLRVNGTPAIFLADGTRLPGFMEAAQLEQVITQAAGR